MEAGKWKIKNGERGLENGFPLPSSIFLFLIVVQLFLAGCSGLSYLPIPPSPTPPPTATSTLTPTPPPTASPTATATLTPTPTPTPAVIVYKTPKPGEVREAEPTPAGDLIASTAHLDFYAEPDNYWAQRIGDVGPAIESDLKEIAERLRTDPPAERIRISLQDPADSPRVRSMDCPARGLYYGHLQSGPMMAIYADENTSRVQVMAVAAHELGHELTFAKFGDGGDIILSEGLANWVSPDTWSAWQDYPSFDAAVRDYRRRGIYLPLEETLDFEPSVERELGLSDCFALRDLRYNEWTSFVDYLIDRYGFEIVGELWEATPENQPFLRRGHAPTVDYEAVLNKDLQQLEQEWLESVANHTIRASINGRLPAPSAHLR